METVRRGLTSGEDGYELWLRYAPLTEADGQDAWQLLTKAIHIPAASETLLAAKAEVSVALTSLWAAPVEFAPEPTGAGLWIGTPRTSPAIAALQLDLSRLGSEGFLIRRVQALGEERLVVTAASDLGVLYGVFRLCLGLASGLSLADIEGADAPKVKLRMLDHWDNLDGSIERGFAGYSLWDWFRLPHVVEPRYVDYARANASIGINAVALTNVNANALLLTEQYLEKVAALANVFRPYGIRVFLTARFSAPMEIDQMTTADPRAAGVQQWWKSKAREIYEHIPDFGGFVVKANSEGQPGPQDYERSHAEGANMLANAVEPFGGVILWRAFVYDSEVPEDRAKQAFSEFVPLDGEFKSNVMLQVKNGPIDFQPREPIHPLFGAMPKTPLMLEFQLTQEYLGNATHLVYLAPLFEEVLAQETFHGEGESADSTVARVVDGSFHQHEMTGVTAVANIGDEPNWCGHPFAAANWYAFGRLCWNPDRKSADLAREWLAMTFNREPQFLRSMTELMLRSREAVVRYMTPLGLHHIMAYNHHQGPGPWVDHGRADWTSTYYHRADADGVGFDRTVAGSGALTQYAPPFQRVYNDPRRCTPESLLWFHRVKWTAVMADGATLWQAMCQAYQRGVDDVRWMRHCWSEARADVDALRFAHVDALLALQEREAKWWKDACLAYFQSINGLPFPDDIEPPPHDVEHYRALEQYYVPGIPERRF